MDQGTPTKWNENRVLIWFAACLISLFALAYQLQGGVDYVYAEALGGMLGIDGLLILVIALSPRSNDSLFGRVRRNEGDFMAITILAFLSLLLMINGLFDLKPSYDGTGLVAGIGLTPGSGVTTLLGILFLLIAMIVLLLLMVAEFLSGSRKINGRTNRMADVI